MCHRLSAVHRAGQGDHVDLGVSGEPVADDGAVTGDDIEHTGGQQVGDEFGKLQCGQRGLLGGLEDHHIAGRKDGGDLPGCHQQWVVPRRDHPDDPEWLAQDDRQVTLGIVGGGLGGDRAGGAGHEPERVDGLRDVVARHHQRLTGVGRFQPGEHIGVLGDSVGDLVQDLGALLGNQPRPTGFGCDGGGNGAIDIVCGTDDDGAEHRFVGGIDDVEGFAVRLGGEFVGDEVTAGRQIRRGHKRSAITSSHLCGRGLNCLGHEILPFLKGVTDADRLVRSRI